MGSRRAEVLDVLSHLIDKSLVVAHRHEDQLRYHLLETIRQYARQKLVGSGVDSGIRDKHLGYYVKWAETALPHLNGAEKMAWLDRFESEHDNLRASLGWSRVSIDGQEEGLRLANARCLSGFNMATTLRDARGWGLCLRKRESRSDPLIRLKPSFMPARLPSIRAIMGRSAGWLNKVWRFRGNSTLSAGRSLPMRSSSLQKWLPKRVIIPRLQACMKRP